MLTGTDRYEVPTGRHTRYSAELTLRSAGSHSGDNLNDLSHHKMTHSGTSSEIRDRTCRCYSEVTLRKRIKQSERSTYPKQATLWLPNHAQFRRYVLLFVRKWWGWFVEMEATVRMANLSQQHPSAVSIVGAFLLNHSSATSYHSPGSIGKRMSRMPRPSIAATSDGIQVQVR